MTRRICWQNITGECRNPMKNMETSGSLECPYCLREDGKDGNGQQLVESEKALKLFEILKDKVKD